VATTSWQLDVKFHDPQRIAVVLPGSDQPTTFWYLLFEVTNNTGHEVEYYPSFSLVTDTLKVVEGGSEISPSVYEAIAARHKREFPFLAMPAKVAGRLLQGEANSRASVAVFRDFDPKASGFDIFVGGLSGEMARVVNPAFDKQSDETEENPRFFVLRRTLGISFDFPGDEKSRSGSIPVRRSREWVMR
jgi:hypothetical protein